MGQQILGSDKILRINNYPLLGMVQSEDWNPNFNPEDIFELGRSSKVDTALELETSGTIEFGSIGSTPGLLARMVPVRAGGAFTGYLWSSSNKNAYTITQDDLVESQFDIVVHMQTDQTNYDKSLWLPRCFLQTITGRADAGGTASESYAWAGNDVVGFESPFHDIISSPCIVNSTTVLDVDDSTVAAATHTLAYVYVDEKRFRNDTTSDTTKFTLSGTAGSAQLTVTTSEGYAIPANAICRAVFFKTSSPSTSFPALLDAERLTSAFYLKGYQVDLFIAPADPDNPLASEQWLRCQSVDYTVNLRSEQLRQLAKNLTGTSVYCRVPTLPFEVTVNASTYETDWADWKAIQQNKNFSGGTTVYEKSTDFAPANLKGDNTAPLAVVLKFYTKNGTLLQTLKFGDLRLEGYGERTAVQGRGEIQWSFRGTAVEWVGANG